ncbi:PCP degradation transcriptional activation protein [BD1-7 clade bacterium]|uniref:PCP degradation transcriptional activation protein n=1 Tax=BD1-7 clade bacterium TaxID=2029982 RepID=A0A5S9PL45_9GAMM|nr:PCP degradation transcriptional activation protein [BD1-7 clade bacterium]
MSIENLSAKDLNLLPVFQVLLEEQNVTRAAGRLNLSQPAISRNLARLRILFDDPLFTRSPKGLSPTPRALSIALTLQSTLQEISHLIEPEIFDPATSDRHFRIATTDYGTQVLLPALIEQLQARAPNVELEILPWDEGVIHNLDSLDIDMAICTVNDAPAGVHGRGVGDDEFVCVLRKGHPLVNQGLTLENYANNKHALITMGGERKGVIDYALEEQGLQRKVTLRVPHFVAALALVARTDLILTVPKGLAKSCADAYSLDILPLPLPQSRFTYSIVWHERMLKDPGHQWLRQLMFESLHRTLIENAS